METEKKTLKKRTICTSMGMKIVLLSSIPVILISTILLLIIIPRMRTMTSDLVKANMVTTAQSYAQFVDGVSENYEEVLSGLTVAGVEDAYGYLIDSDGVILYHPYADLIGTKADDSFVNEVLNNLDSGVDVEDASTVYEYEGNTKYAGFTVLEDHKLLIVTGSEDYALEDLLAVKSACIINNFVVALFVILITAFIGYKTAMPIRKLSNTIQIVSKHDYSEKPELEKLSKRRDEIGAMAEATEELLQSMRKMILQMNNKATNVTGIMEDVYVTANMINVSSADNSATTEELAAGMEETTATTEAIAKNVEMMKQRANDIDELAVKSRGDAEEILMRAGKLKDNASASTLKAKDMYDDIRVKTEQAIKDNKTVDQISELTGEIMKISSQTSLLALNASIEAARAGEAGKGFAVVAEEIGNLAEQTSNAVSNIENMVQIVNNTSAHMQTALEETIVFLEETVLNDYQTLTDVGEKYNQDANTFRNSMGVVRESVEDLMDVIKEISVSIEGINNMVNESAIGVTDIAEKTQNTVKQTETNHRLADECTRNMEELIDVIDIFVLS